MDGTWFRPAVRPDALRRSADNGLSIQYCTCAGVCVCCPASGETLTMSLAMTPAMAGRTTRLTALVSEAEAAQIARQAEAAGLSVSAYLRDCALGASRQRRYRRGAGAPTSRCPGRADGSRSRSGNRGAVRHDCPHGCGVTDWFDRLDAPRGPRRAGHDLDGWGQGSGEQARGPSGAPGAPGDDRRDLTAGRRRAAPRSEAAGGYADIAVGPSQRSRRGRFARIRFKATR